MRVKHTATVVAMSLCLPALAGAQRHDGRITNLSHSRERIDGESTLATVLRVEVRRRDLETRQSIRLSVQAKGTDGTVRFATVESSGGRTTQRGRSGPVTASWAFRINMDDMESPQLSYEAVLINADKEEVHRRNRGIQDPVQWEKENEDRPKLDVKQFFDRRGLGI